ncbi:hypothetical protein BDW68DRAFT_182913 [Aspergillus falconensis]
MAPYARPAGPNESEGQIKSDSSSAVGGIFSDNGSDNDSNSDLEDSGESDDGNEQDKESFIDEALVEWYSDTTQEKLDESRVYWKVNEAPSL